MGRCTTSFQLIDILVSELCCEGHLVSLGVLRFSLVMSSSQPGVRSLEKGLSSRDILLQWRSEHPCPTGKRGSTATAAQQRQRCANTRGDRQIPPGDYIGTVVGSRRCHGTSPGSSSRSTATARQKSAWDRRLNPG